MTTIPQTLTRAVALGAPLAVTLAAATSVHARPYVVDYCGATATAEGWSAYATQPGTSEIGCGPGSGFLRASLNGTASWGQGSFAALTFQAPPGTTIAGWNPTLRYTVYKSTENTERLQFTAGTWPSASPGIKCVNLGCPQEINAVAVSPGTTQVQARTECVNERPDFDLCHFNAEILDLGGRVTLDDPTPPTGRTAATGSLVGASTPLRALRGSGEVQVLVDDVGSGVASTQLLIDGQPAATATNGCTPQPTTRLVPCALSQHAGLAWDSTRVPDGQHTAALVATDAAGNQTTVWQGAIYVANSPVGPGSPVELRGDPTVPGASDQVRVTATFPSTKRRGKRSRSLWLGSYSKKRTVTITGRVTDAATRQPLAEAPVLIVGELTRGPGEPLRIQTRTNSAGRYTVRLPRNEGSRNLQVGFRARTNDTVPAGAASARMLVRSTLSLRTSRRAVRAGRAVRFTGRLSDHAAGVPVVMEVWAGGKWRVFAATSSKTSGRYTARYGFGRAGRGRYRFRARTKPTRATPWSYVGAPSRPVRVRVR